MQVINLVQTGIFMSFVEQERKLCLCNYLCFSSVCLCCTLFLRESDKDMIYIIKKL